MIRAPLQPAPRPPVQRAVAPQHSPQAAGSPPPAPQYMPPQGAGWDDLLPWNDAQPWID